MLMGHDRRAGSTRTQSVKRVTIAVAFFIASCWTLSSPAIATHETDHRFTVEGFVCGPNGQPVADEKVIVKDTRASITEAAYTDSYGYYKAVLHLHNDNVGDPLLIKVQDTEQQAKVQFDPKDRTSERAITVNFGAGCEGAGGPGLWVYYGAGIVAAVFAAYAGARIIRGRRRASGKGAKQARKARRT